MRAFVVRAFGERVGVDFDRVHELLITPALAAVHLEGGTTGLILEGGNVREDMFRELIMADVVIADISVHNANVFYELGVRHAVRPRATVLIRARIDEVPFDLKTDRYLKYDPLDPAAAVSDLVKVLRETLGSERVDSPVFQLLPGFEAGSRSGLLQVPRDLAEEIGQARENKWAGDLRLIAEEVVGLRFEEAALRAVAQASADVGDDEAAKNAWERIRAAHPDDFQANRALSDIYRRLDDQLVASDQAVERALSGSGMSSRDRAELFALRGSNSKRRWADRWRLEDQAEARTRVALQAGERQSALESYRRGFEEDLNHWYPGLNALAMAKITLHLAETDPESWQTRFETDEDADLMRQRLTAEVVRLTSVVRSSLEGARSRALREGVTDPWLDVSVADLRFLTSDDPKRVSAAYAAAMSPALSQTTIRSIRDQVQLYRDLGVLVENADATLEVLPPTVEEGTVPIFPLVFCGHMIDAPGRPEPRFPADKEHLARRAIHDAVRHFAASLGGDGAEVLGIAGASDGGDLLFHEACHELGIKSHVLLPVPELAYRSTALSRQASRWAERYYAALRRAEQVRILSRTDDLPGWLAGKPGYSTWRRNNRWILNHAWASSTSDRVTLLALWDGQVGDGPGGVHNMVATAQQLYADVVTLDTVALFGLAETPEATAPRAVTTQPPEIAPLATGPATEPSVDPAVAEQVGPLGGKVIAGADLESSEKR